MARSGLAGADSATLPAGAALHRELRDSQVEAATGICRDAGQLREHLLAGRRGLADVARAVGAPGRAHRQSAAAAQHQAGPDRLVITELPDIAHLALPERYVVVHPGASVPARAWSPSRNAAAVTAITAAGHPVVVTGTPNEAALTADVAGRHGRGHAYARCPVIRASTR